MVKKSEKDERADKLQACLSKIHQAQSDLKSRAFTIGQQLVLARPLFDTAEEFDVWVKTETGISRGSSYNYRVLWTVWHAKNTDHFSLPALYLLAADGTPEEAETEALRLAKKGNKITEEVARQIVAACTHPKEPSTSSERTSAVQDLDIQAGTPAPTNGKRGTAFDPDTASRPEASAPEDNPDDDGPSESELRESLSPDELCDEVFRPRPLARLIDLPDDFAEAVEAMKLTILRHKLNGWLAMSLDDATGTLDDLKAIAKAPAEKPEKAGASR